MPEAPGPQRLARSQDLVLEGVEVSAGGARGVWSRHVRLTKPKCLLCPEQATASSKIKLSEEQIRLPERFSPKSRERHSEARHTADLVAADTFFLGTLKGVGESLPRA
ncbi:MAG TPA: hypothetical protein VLS27_18865 [Gammaproteobacteria bacterium]|nr:hypothetical protein [Gammaproteobacteria bacterium]